MVSHKESLAAVDRVPKVVFTKSRRWLEMTGFYFILWNQDDKETKVIFVLKHLHASVSEEFELLAY